jgi:serine/threonine protein kinase
MSPYDMGGSSIEPGQVLGGKFRVERVLGKGGMGIVVAARHLGLDELVALKFMLPEVLSSRDAVDRFLREARSAVKLRGENVCRVMDVGELENGAPYIVMEYLEGVDLGQELARRGTLSLAEASAFVVQACEAMAEAHALGIVHRDLKPQNLFLTRRANGSALVKVLDFGISKANIGQAGAQTQTQQLMGSPAYMSPEQMRSAKNVDARTDVYALGAILYQLLSARLPFVADTLPELCLKVMSDPPVPLRQLRPDVPPGLEALVMRCLEKDRERRPASVSELAASLVPFASQGQGLATLPPAPTPLAAMPTILPRTTGADSTLGAAASQKVSKHEGIQEVPLVRNRKVLVLSTALVGTLAIVGVAVVFGGSRNRPAIVPAPGPTWVEQAPVAARGIAIAEVAAAPAVAPAPVGPPDAGASVAEKQSRPSKAVPRSRPESARAATRASVSRPQPPASIEDPVERARRLYGVGTQSFASGQFDVAIAAFEESFKLAPYTSVKFSLAMSYRAQYFVDKDERKLRRAVELYRLVLAEVPSGELHDRAGQYLEQLEPFVAR